jgi:LuxR family maltose regulon positive regulatory protein
MTFEMTGDDIGQAFSLLTLGNVARDQGDYEAAEKYFQQGFVFEKQRGALRGMSWALWGLAGVAQRSKRFSEAREHMVELLRLLHAETGLRLTLYVATLGEIEYALGNFQSAWQRFCEALKITIERPYMACTSLGMLVWLSRLLIANRMRERAVEVLSLVRHHPACPSQVQDEAARLLNELEAEMPHQAFVGARERGKASNLETMAATLIEEFQVAGDEPQMAAWPAANRALIDPLTDRELEVLHLIGEGMSNREIAEKLVLAVGTVKWYVSQIYGKLDAQNRVQAIARASELNLFP